MSSNISNFLKRTAAAVVTVLAAAWTVALGLFAALAFMSIVGIPLGIKLGICAAAAGKVTKEAFNYAIDADGERPIISRGFWSNMKERCTTVFCSPGLSVK